MEANNEKRVLNIELTNDVKRVSITAKNANDQVVMKQELSDADLDQATGGAPELPKRTHNPDYNSCPSKY